MDSKLSFDELKSPTTHGAVAPIDDLSRPQRIRHLFRFLIRGMIAAVSGIGLWNNLGHEPSVQMMLFACLSTLFLLGAFRSLYSMFCPPRMMLSPDGIDLKCWQSSMFDWILPFRAKAIEVKVPWAEVIDVESRESKSRWSISSSLTIRTSAAKWEVPSDVFGRSVNDLMFGILNYQEVLKSAQLRAFVRFNDFQRQRFQVSQRLAASVSMGMPGCLGLFFILFSGFVIWGAFHQGLTLLGIGLIISCLAILAYFNPGNWVSSDIIECRSEGLALGASDDKLELFPWSDVLSGRFIMTTVSSPLKIPMSDGRSVRRRRRFADGRNR